MGMGDGGREKERNNKMQSEREGRIMISVARGAMSHLNS